MRVLLDTHVFVWVRSDHPRLPQAFRHVIADPRVVKYVSSLTAAELLVKKAIGKLTVDGDIPTDIEALGFDEIPFTHAHARTMESLPLLHRDPFDRMLIAQAISEDLVFLTVDSACMQYDVRQLAVD